MDILGISYLHLSPFRYFTSVAILENNYNLFTISKKTLSRIKNDDGVHK